MKENWTKARLGDVAQIVTGNTPSTSKPEYFGGEIPFVTPAELDKNLPITKSKTTLTALGAEQSRLLPSETVMVCCIGSLGKIGIAGTTLVTNQQINSLIFDKTKVLPRYGYQYCRTLKHYLEHIAPSTTLPIINKSRFSALEIPLPPLPEQKRIAEVLDKADALREKRRLALQKLDTLLQSVFLEMFGDPVKNPKGWKETTISEICFVKGGKRLPKGDDYSPTLTDFRYIRVTDIKNGKIAEKQLHYLYPETQSQISRYIVNEGDVIISIAGSIGLIAPVPKTLDGVNLTENAAKLCSRKSNEYNSIFLSSILKSDYAQQQIVQHTGQVTIGKLALFRIEKIKILLPPIELQNEFETFVKKFEALKDRLNNSLKITENLFQSLQQRAFKGELFSNEFPAIESQDEKVWQQTSLF